MTAYINLENFVKDVIVQCMDRNGYVGCGHLRYMVDLHLAAGPSNLKFLPSKIEDGILIISFTESNDDFVHHKTFDVENIIKEYLEKSII